LEQKSILKTASLEKCIKERPAKRFLPERIYKFLTSGIYRIVTSGRTNDTFSSAAGAGRPDVFCEKIDQQ
jgi:hypothetical protein